MLNLSNHLSKVTQKADKRFNFKIESDKISIGYKIKPYETINDVNDNGFTTIEEIKMNSKSMQPSVYSLNIFEKKIGNIYVRTKGKTLSETKYKELLEEVEKLKKEFS